MAGTRQMFTISAVTIEQCQASMSGDRGARRRSTHLRFRESDIADEADVVFGRIYWWVLILKLKLITDQESPGDLRSEERV